MQDLRRTLAIFMTDKRMPGGASAILAHEVKESESLTPSATERQRADFKRQHLARITQLAYHAETQVIDIKNEAMALWTNAVLDEYQRQKRHSYPNTKSSNSEAWRPMQGFAILSDVFLYEIDLPDTEPR